MAEIGAFISQLVSVDIPLTNIFLLYSVNSRYRNDANQEHQDILPQVSLLFLVILLQKSVNMSEGHGQGIPGQHLGSTLSNI